MIENCVSCIFDMLLSVDLSAELRCDTVYSQSSQTATVDVSWAFGGGGECASSAMRVALVALEEGDEGEL